MLLSTALRKIGWRAFALMWIPFGLLMISMIPQPPGEYSWAELPLLARISIVSGGVLAVVAMAALFGAPLASGVANRNTLARGVLAEATILRVWQTGTTINNNPVVGMQLEVRPSGQPSFEAEVERLVPLIQLPQLQPGEIVSVKYDPESQAVAIVDDEDGAMA